MSRATAAGFYSDKITPSSFATAEWTDLFQPSVEASRAHLAACCDGTTCRHPFVETWDLSRCAFCAADVGAARRAEEEEAKAAAEREDAAINDEQGQGERLRGSGVSLEFLVAFTVARDCWGWPTWRVHAHMCTRRPPGASTAFSRTH